MPGLQPVPPCARGASASPRAATGGLGAAKLRGTSAILLAAAILPAAPTPVPAQEEETAAGGSEHAWTLDGQVRLRGEWDGRTVDAGDDAVTLSRIRAGVRVEAESWMSVYLQVQDARAWGSEESTLTDADADQLDLHQGFVELGGEGGPAVRLGRQELALADERLVGTVGWTNTGRVFDGARVMGRAGALEWTAFWMNVAERDALVATGLDPQANEGENEDGWLLGAFAARELPGATVELTALADRKALTDESYTLNLRAHGASGRLLWEAAGAFQTGPDRSAFFASGRLGMRLDRGTLAAQVDWLSGDDDPADDEVEAFHTLYATNHRFYGYMDYFLGFPDQLVGTGLVDVMLRASAALPRRATVRADLHHFRAAEERLGESVLGTELDLVGTLPLAEPARAEAGVGLFFPGDLASLLLPAFAAGDDATLWGYLQLTVGW